MAQQRIAIDTLGAVKAAGERVTAHCDACLHSQRLDVDELIARLGAGFEIVPQRLNPLLRCSRCGHKGATVHFTPQPKSG